MICDHVERPRSNLFPVGDVSVPADDARRLELESLTLDEISERMCVALLMAARLPESEHAAFIEAVRSGLAEIAD